MVITEELRRNYRSYWTGYHDSLRAPCHPVLLTGGGSKKYDKEDDEEKKSGWWSWLFGSKDKDTKDSDQKKKIRKQGGA